MPFLFPCVALSFREQGEKGHFLNEQYESLATKGSSQCKLFRLGKPFFQQRSFRGEEGSSSGKRRPSWARGLLQPLGREPPAHPRAEHPLPMWQGTRRLQGASTGSSPFPALLIFDTKGKSAASHQALLNRKWGFSGKNRSLPGPSITFSFFCGGGGGQI